jgi:hypothetical protein
MAGESLAIGGAIASSIIASTFAKANVKKQKELEEQLNELSLEQQKELQTHLQTIQGEIEKQKIVYKYLADKNLQQVEKSIKSKRYTAYIVLGGAVVLLVGVMLLSKLKK